MKKFLTLIALAVSLSASADDYSLYYDLASGVKNTQVGAVASLQKLVFDEEGNMIVYKKDGSTVSIDITCVTRLFFATPEAVAIKTPEAKETADLKNAQVYDLTGRKIAIDLTTEKLPRGIYIINGKKTSVK